MKYSGSVFLSDFYFSMELVRMNKTVFCKLTTEVKINLSELNSGIWILALTHGRGHRILMQRCNAY